MTHLSRRHFIGTVGLSACLVDWLAANPLADQPATAKLSEAADRGRRFLESLFDSTLDLLPEYRGAEVYWLFHDNYLAAKVLAKSNPELAGKIKGALARFGYEHSGKIEIVFGESRQPLPFRQYELIDVKKIDKKIIKTEIVTEKILKGWEGYADLLFMAALAEPDSQKARQHLDAGMKLWDGTGFNDPTTKTLHRYATYKLALSLIAARKLKVPLEQKPAILEQLLAMQAQDGGWITDYDEKRKPVGLANVETTSLAIVALEAAIKSE